MSLKAMIWALKEAPDVPAHCLGVLMGLAERADDDGRGAYPSTQTLARWARKGERQAQNDLDKLADLKLIRLGDQSIAAHLPANRRTVVYDLAVEWSRALGANPGSPQAGVNSTAGQNSGSPQAGVNSGSPQEPPDLRKSGGPDVSAGQLGCSVVPAGVKPAAPNTFFKTTASPSEKHVNGGAGGVLFGEDPSGATKGARSRKPKARRPEHPRFAEWYQAFPLHKARADASEAYHHAVDAGTDPDVLLAAAIAYRRDSQVIRGYSKYPATWLNKECWTDEPTPPPAEPAAPNGARPASFTDEEYRSGW